VVVKRKRSGESESALGFGTVDITQGGVREGIQNFEEARSKYGGDGSFFGEAVEREDGLWR